MSKLYKKPKTVEQIIQSYWLIHRQWNGHTTEGKITLTVSQANACLRDIIDDSRVTPFLKIRVRKLQSDIISNNRKHKRKERVRAKEAISSTITQ
jgi:hypothetical protein